MSGILRVNGAHERDKHVSGPGVRSPANGENAQERRGVGGQGSKSCSGLLKSQEQAVEEADAEAGQVDEGENPKQSYM